MKATSTKQQHSAALLMTRQDPLNYLVIGNWQKLLDYW
jgi:hypothetical protein